MISPPVTIRLIQSGDDPLLSAYYLENHDHFRPWEPLTPAGFHMPDAWEARLRERLTEQRNRKAAYFVTVDPIVNKIIGHCTLSQIFYGSFMACYMGYAIARSHEGRGVMRQTCLHAIDYAFNELNLNRIMANYMPHNNRSARLLKSLGFAIEGKADNYLRINGRWENHFLTALLNPRRP